MGDNREVGRKSFILHIDSLAILDELTNEQKGILFDAIYKYQKGENVELDFAMRIAFLPFKNQFERDFESYLSRCNSNKINGLKGGRPKKQTKPKETEKTQSVILKPKKADNDSESDSDSVNDSNKENKHPLQIDFDNAFDDFVKMRKEIGKKITERGQELIKNKLRKLSGNNIVKATAILNQSIENSWQGVFELKESTPQEIKRGGNPNARLLKDE